MPLFAQWPGTGKAPDGANDPAKLDAEHRAGLVLLDQPFQTLNSQYRDALVRKEQEVRAAGDLDAVPAFKKVISAHLPPFSLGSSSMAV